jgi:hypothetical protein
LRPIVFPDRVSAHKWPITGHLNVGCYSPTTGHFSGALSAASWPVFAVATFDISIYIYSLYS